MVGIQGKEVLLSGGVAGLGFVGLRGYLVCGLLGWSAASPVLFGLVLSVGRWLLLILRVGLLLVLNLLPLLLVK